MNGYLRSVILLLGGLLILTIAMAILNTLVPLWLEQKGISTVDIGFVGSSYFIGNLVGVLIAVRFIYRYGFNRSYYLAALVFTISVVGLMLSFNIYNWLFWRFLAGIAISSIWLIVESGLLKMGSVKQRGVLLAAYMVVYYLGTVVGQLMLPYIPNALHYVLPLMVIISVLAIFPLLFTILPRPEKEKNHVSLLKMFMLPQARLGIIGCVVSGIVLGSFYSLLPVYLVRTGIQLSDVGYWMALIVGAGIIGQWPMGWVAGRFGREFSTKLQLVMVMIGCVMVCFPILNILTYIILGWFSFTLYPIVMAWGCEGVEQKDVVTMNQALLLSYTVGSLIGPSLAGFFMEHIADMMLFVIIFIVSFLYVLVLFKRYHHHSGNLMI